MLNVGLGKTRLTRKEVANSVSQQTSKACFLQIIKQKCKYPQRYQMSDGNLGMIIGISANLCEEVFNLFSLKQFQNQFNRLFSTHREEAS